VLGPYRVLDLTDHRGELGPKLLADLGADVIRVEPPQGSEARRRGPRLAGVPDAEASLQFFAYNRNKRSIVLELGDADDRALFLQLVASADFLFESSPPGALAPFGLGFDELRAVNPQIVHVQVTPFGSDGPYCEHAATDLVIASLGGQVAIQGDPGRPPVRISVPQVWRHAGAEAAVAALVAQARMRASGEAQLVDVSAQCAMTWTMLNAMVAASIQGRDFERGGSTIQLGSVTYRTVYPCSDGYVVTLGYGPTISRLGPWLREDGVIDEAMLRADWAELDSRRLQGEPAEYGLADVEAVLERFCARHAKDELLERSLALGATIAPVSTVADLLCLRQLRSRGFYDEVRLPSGLEAKMPGAHARASRTPLRTAGVAPRLDEHGAEIRAELARGSRAVARVTPTGAALPLEGLKVLDLTWIGVGPISTRCLADHGATVVKVESETRADGLRFAGPFADGKPGWNRSQFFGDFNTSKLDLCLDLKHPQATEIARKLVAWADVFVESYTPGAIARVGLGYETLRALKPSLVMLSTCLMGQTGPHKHMAGYGYHAGALAGFTELTGWPDAPPAGPYQAYTDVVAPRFLIATLLAAVDHARRTGEGQHIDLAQLEAGLQFLAPELLDYQANSRLAARLGNRGCDAVPQGVYPCKGEDQWCAVAVESEAQWSSLCRVLRAQDWLADAALASPAGRAARHDELDLRIARWTCMRSPREAMEILQASGVPAGAVQRSHELVHDPQYLHRGFHHPLEHPEMGLVPYTGHQWRIRGYASGPRWAAPTLGQHSFQVLTEIAGLSADEISELVACGAVR
jgi:crotonobetainyl-CoA:carnitine CoA-transferase CaiB-like acyl-CoA transferase